MVRKITILLAATAFLASCMLGFCGTRLSAQTQPATGLANPLQQRAEMIEELRAIRNLLREQNDLLREQLHLLRKLSTLPSGPVPGPAGPAAPRVDIQRLP